MPIELGAAGSRLHLAALLPGPRRNWFANVSLRNRTKAFQTTNSVFYGLLEFLVMVLISILNRAGISIEK